VGPSRWALVKFKGPSTGGEDERDDWAVESMCLGQASLATSRLILCVLLVLKYLLFLT
jgi:hypothetical protein